MNGYLNSWIDNLLSRLIDKHNSLFETSNKVEYINWPYVQYACNVLKRITSVTKKCWWKLKSWISPIIFLFNLLYTCLITLFNKVYLWYPVFAYVNVSVFVRARAFVCEKEWVKVRSVSENKNRCQINWHKASWKFSKF